MARYRMRVRTDWSPGDAFAYMADLSNFDDWDPGTKSAVQVEGDGPGSGAEYDLEASGAKLRYVVQAYDPTARVQARAHNRFITSVDTITVAAEGDGSVITYEADLTLNGPLRIGDPLLKLFFKRLGDKAADGLVAKTEGTRLS